ncbi:type I-F CRISPR-associated endoribonuclease Cas6/Csy4 [Enterovibrio paralichthyis]|uniref:type I-F CRISPR-associated endoribonuclease Cas6/Csy4 n=1 Tax=Enterovibrio paralichthyis TaxID=2853805 RepID=UPI001C44F618|nr:type I-F CRISPR-associated endoribonuclease Cas6/Csy4 [Enterovibrio paralichthyis]MBV7297712.1 type I-F CRISPR-associated endoribonuclease Cas6/Csy4 [Enterovibrio paralichthyis]
MKWFLKSIAFLPELRNNEALATKCIQVLHGFNYAHDTRKIGVSFPLWCNESVGRAITFVCTDKWELECLLKQSYFVKMQELGYFDVSTLQIAPKDCSYVAFERKHTIDKTMPGQKNKRLRRLEKRALARGEQFEPSRYAKSEAHIIEHYHSLKEQSSQNGSPFRLNIVKNCSPSRTPTGHFSSYGLANSEDNYQVVPLVEPFFQTAI